MHLTISVIHDNKNKLFSKTKQNKFIEKNDNVLYFWKSLYCELTHHVASGKLHCPPVRICE